MINYPTKIEANGHIYNINTNYRVALNCLKAINDNEINDMERAIAIITLLLGKNVDENDYPICLEKCSKYLRCGRDDNINNDEIDMDYFEDDSYIKTSIRQCFQINLNEVEYLHWWEFNELIEGLTEDTVLSRIREIRNLNEREIKNDKERQKIVEIKERFSLKKNKDIILTKEQEESMNKLDEIIGFKNRR